MRTTSIINLKGGVGKTITSVNLAYQLCQRGNRVLVIDCDKQGNTSRFFKAYGYDNNSLAEILTGEAIITETAIRYCVTENDKGLLDVIPANMNLLSAHREIALNIPRPQQTTRLKMALDEVRDYYDYCIIDCAPDINISVINALVASDDVIIPTTIDEFSLDGINEIMQQVRDTQKYYPQLLFIGCLITKYRNDDFQNEGIEEIENMCGKVFDTKISYTNMVSKSTFVREPLTIFSPRCKAAKCYVKFTDEYIASRR